jgi:hypothetical protein
MSRSFKAPKRSDAEQWQKVQALWSAGFRFWSYRSHPDAEPLPERLRDVDDFIRRDLKHPDAHRAGITQLFFICRALRPIRPVG